MADNTCRLTYHEYKYGKHCKYTIQSLRYKYNRCENTHIEEKLKNKIKRLFG